MSWHLLFLLLLSRKALGRPWGRSARADWTGGEELVSSDSRLHIFCFPVVQHVVVTKNAEQNGLLARSPGSVEGIGTTDICKTRGGFGWSAHVRREFGVGTVVSQAVCVVF